LAVVVEVPKILKLDFQVVQVEVIVIQQVMLPGLLDKDMLVVAAGQAQLVAELHGLLEVAEVLRL
jgi:hypothetical protein